MRWENETSIRPYYFDLIYSYDIVYDAYKEGYLKRHLFNKAIERITSNLNGLKNGYWKYENPDYLSKKHYMT